MGKMKAAAPSLERNAGRGMVVHPAAGNPDGTIVNALLHHCGDLPFRLMAYTKGFPGAKEMRSRLVRVSSMPELEDLLSKLPRQKP